MIQQINETKSWFFEKINKNNKTLAKLIKRRKQKTQILKIRYEKGDITKTPMQLRRSYGNILKSYTSTNWKIKKKKINFLTHTTYQN
jgi:hypothetical protein